MINIKCLKAKGIYAFWGRAKTFQTIQFNSMLLKYKAEK
jgi:hypothetical protein